MEKLLSLVTFTGDARLGGADSFSDRLSCRYTVVLMTFLGLGVTAFQWLGTTPIYCWCPPHFTSSMVDYTNAACWAQNTYYLTFEERIPKHKDDKNYLNYYQWVGLALFFQSLVFYLPRVLWQQLSKISGVAVCTITDAAISYQKSTSDEECAKILRYTINHLSRFLFEAARLHKRKLRQVMSCFGWILPVSYLFVKLVYLANVLLQLMILEKFLHIRTEDDVLYLTYGAHVLKQLVQGESWSTSERFPKVTLCDIRIRETGNVHNYTIQCALPMNLFNEKIYIFVWFWLFFVGVLTVFSFISWSYSAVFLMRQESHIYSRLKAVYYIPPRAEHHSGDVTVIDAAIQKIKSGCAGDAEACDILADIACPCPNTKYKPEWKEVYVFIHDFLKRDGVFILLMVGKNTSDLIAAEILYGVWQVYIDNNLREKKCKKLHGQGKSGKTKDAVALLAEDKNGSVKPLNNHSSSVTRRKWQEDEPPERKLCSCC